jgi:chromosome partitioning protein
MRVAVVQTKGGVGKTTLAVNIAVERSRSGRRVLLVDGDKQATAASFTAARTEALGHPGYTAVQLADGAVHTQTMQMAGDYSDVVIDAGGRDNKGLRAALVAAEVAVIPFQPRSFDVWVLDTMAELVAEARIYNPNLKAFAIVNCADPQGADNAAAAEVLAGAEGIAFLDCPIGRRKAFPNSSARGLGIGELKGKDHDPKALAELTALINAIFTEE